MKILLLAAVSACALVAGGCSSTQKPPARAALDCPATEGDLTRTAVAPDRRSCTYTTDEGAEVVLRLVDTNGDPRAALAALEASLMGTPAPSPAETVPAADAKTVADAAKAADEARKDAGMTVAADGDGVRVATRPAKGETTRIDLPGIHILAGDENADVRLGPITVNAQGDEATVRIFTDQRLKGEAFSREKRGLKATFIYAGDNLTNGYGFVGYEAAGPKAGPLTVALVRSRQSEGEDQNIEGDVKRLVRRNSDV